MHAKHRDAAIDCQNSRKSSDDRSDGGPAARIRTNIMCAIIFKCIYIFELNATVVISNVS